MSVEDSGTTVLTPGSVLITNGTLAMLTVTVTGDTVSVIVTVDASAEAPQKDSVLLNRQ